MTDGHITDGEEPDGELPNPPAGETTDTPFDDEEVRELIHGAVLHHYTPGTGKHSGNVMAVFRTEEGAGVGLTMSDDSHTPDDLIGETVRDTRPFVQGRGISHGKAYILFEDRDPSTEKIIVRNTQAIGLYEVADPEEVPDLAPDGGEVVEDDEDDRPYVDPDASPEQEAALLADSLETTLHGGAATVEADGRTGPRVFSLTEDATVERHGARVEVTDGSSVHTLNPSTVRDVRPTEWGFTRTKRYHFKGTPVEVEVRVADRHGPGEATSGERKVVHDSVLDAADHAARWDERRRP